MSEDSPSASGRLPNLYALLGLKALEPDPARIQQSLQRLASQIQVRSQAEAQDASSQAQVQRARKLFELGERQLLDPARKTRYDQQWQIVYGSESASSSTPLRASKQPEKLAAEGHRARPLKKQQTQAGQRPAVANNTAPAARAALSWDLNELQAVLPEGDPHAPFNAAEFLASRSPEAAARYVEDFDKLRSLLAPSEPSGQAAAHSANQADAAVSHAAVSHAAGGEPAAAQSPADKLAGKPAEKLVALSQPSDRAAAELGLHAQPAAATPLAQRLRKKQGPAPLWTAISTLAAVGIVLGVAYWRLQPAKVQPAKVQPANSAALAAKPLPNAIQVQAAVGGSSSATEQSAATTPANTAAPRRSGLPSVPGIDAVMPTADVAQADSSTAAANSFPVPAATQNSGMQNNGMQDIAMEDGAMQDNGMQDNGMQDNGMQDMPASAATGGGQAISLSDDERQQWTDSMLAARAALGQQQFAQASEQLSRLRALAKTQLQRQQLARLMSVAQLAQRFRQELSQALSGMGAAESFSFGDSDLASFVEADEQRVVLRIEGRNQTYAMTQLPVEIAFAIVDQAMDREHPQSLAAKAAFALVHPAAQGDVRVTQYAQQMMADAVDARAVAQDMPQALLDDFVLPP